jgi:hypothetical protein
VTVVEIVEVPAPPWPMLRLLGLALIEKSEGPLLQLENLNEPILVCQLKLPFDARY